LVHFVAYRWLEINRVRKQLSEYLIADMVVSRVVAWSRVVDEDDDDGAPSGVLMEEER
jgi:hypothetical protein